MLLNYLSRPNVRQQGVEIRGEAVVQGEHSLFLIVESSDEQRLRDLRCNSTIFEHSRDVVLRNLVALAIHRTPRQPNAPPIRVAHFPLPLP